MPIVGLRNQSAQAIGSADHLDIEDRNWGAAWVDSTGGQQFVLGQGPFTLNLDSEVINSAPEIFSLSTDIVTIVEAGLYLFSFQLTAAHNGGSSVCVNHVWLEEDPDSGSFAAIARLDNYFPVSAISSARGSGQATGIVQVGIDYRYRLRFEQSYGSSGLITLANLSKLSIIRLFKNG